MQFLPGKARRPQGIFDPYQTQIVKDAMRKAASSEKRARTRLANLEAAGADDQAIASAKGAIVSALYRGDQRILRAVEQARREHRESDRRLPAL